MTPCRAAIQNNEGSEEFTIAQLVSYEVHRPNLIGLIRYCQGIWPVAFESLFGFDLLPSHGLRASHERVQI